MMEPSLLLVTSLTDFEITRDRIGAKMQQGRSPTFRGDK